MPAELTQEELKRLLDYDPGTGVFTWKAGRRCVRPGDIAGTRTDRGYISIKVNRKLHKAHRLAWLYVNGEWPPDQIDHINRVRDDNRIENLRAVSHRENNKNRVNNTPFPGVCFDNHRQKWKAYIYFDGRKKHLGYFTTKLAACYARHQSEINLT